MGTHSHHNDTIIRQVLITFWSWKAYLSSHTREQVNYLYF